MCGFWIPTSLTDLLFLHSHKLHKSTFVLVDTVLYETAVSRTVPAEQMIECPVTKGGTVLGSCSTSH